MVIQWLRSPSLRPLPPGRDRRTGRELAGTSLCLGGQRLAFAARQFLCCPGVIAAAAVPLQGQRRWAPLIALVSKLAGAVPVVPSPQEWWCAAATPR